MTMTNIFWMGVAFVAGCLFTAWRFKVHSAAFLAQARVVAKVFTESVQPVGPELEKLGRIYYLSHLSRRKTWWKKIASR